MKTNVKVLFICKKRKSSGPGPYAQIISSGLLNSATFVNDMLVKNGVDSKIIEVIDNNCIDREVTQFKPTHVIIEALWVVPSKFEILQRLHPNVKWIIRLHSETPFLANEGIAMEWIFEYQKYDNVYVSINSPRIEKELNSVLPKISLYLPNYYPVEFGLDHFKPIPNRDYIDIGCFGAIRPMKNQLLQAIAAIKFANEIGKKLHFHINCTRVENNGDPVIKNIRSLFENSPHQLIEHLWMPHEEFSNLIKTMDMCLQVSFSETYNIVTADAVNNNVPVVVSPEITWVAGLFKALPTDSCDIIKTMHLTYYLKCFRVHFINKLMLHWNSKEAESVWLDYFAEEGWNLPCGNCSCGCECEYRCECGCYNGGGCCEK